MITYVVLRNNINKSLSDGPVLSIMVHKQLVHVSGGFIMGISPRPHDDQHARGENRSSEIGVSTGQTRDFRHDMPGEYLCFGETYRI